MIRSLSLLAVALTAAAACSGEDDRPPPPAAGAASGSSGASGAGRGGAAGRAGSGGSSGSGARDGGADAGGSGGRGTGGASGDGGSSGDGGDAGDAGPPVCGNGVAERSEACDGNDLREQACNNYGFERGALACEDCSLVFSGCVGTENCADGRDNDGDQAVDCADEDCRPGCADACTAPVPLPDPALVVPGQTNGHPSLVTPSCARGSGSEVVYSFTASRTGVADVRLTSLASDFNLSVRRECANAQSEVACAERNAGAGAVERVNLQVTQGDTLFIVVDGTGSVAGRYTLDVESRVVECGDRQRDAGEACDDGNRDPNDGCSPTCELEADETEPNGTSGQATPYSGFPFIGSIGAPGDVDFYAIEVPNAGSTITAETLDMGDGTCAQNLLDSAIDIIAPDGTTAIASDDDSGDGYCSVATVSGAGPGRHFVRVRASGVAVSFPYVLNVAVTRP